jgi:hypothetical protein
MSVGFETGFVEAEGVGFETADISLKKKTLKLGFAQFIAQE